MQYKRISADCHLDMPWMPPDLFTSMAPRDMKDRMPFVIDTDEGPKWTAKNGASFGFKNGIPIDADFVFDVRCLPNPHYDPALRPLTGLSQIGRAHV